MSDQFQKRSRKVSFTLTKHYGTASVTIGLEDTAEINSLAEQAVVLKRLQDQVAFHFGEYERGTSLMQVSKSPDPDTKGLGVDTYEDTALELCKEVKSGQTYFYVKTTKFNKHGLAFYKDKEGYAQAIALLGDAYSVKLTGVKAVIFERGTTKKIERLLF